MYVNHASHALSKMQFVNASNLGTSVLHLVRRQISEAQIWHIIGLQSTEMSFKYIWRHMCYHYTVVSRLARKYTQTITVKDLPRSGRPHETSQCEDRTLHRLVRRMPFAHTLVLNRQWLPNRRLSASARAVRNRLKSAGLKSKAVIKCTILSDRHQRLRLPWWLARRYFF
jgi:transposase